MQTKYLRYVCKMLEFSRWVSEFFAAYFFGYFTGSAQPYGVGLAVYLSFFGLSMFCAWAKYRVELAIIAKQRKKEMRQLGEMLEKVKETAEKINEQAPGYLHGVGADVDASSVAQILEAKLKEEQERAAPLIQKRDTEKLQQLLVLIEKAVRDDAALADRFIELPYASDAVIRELQSRGFCAMTGYPSRAGSPTPLMTFVVIPHEGETPEKTRDRLRFAVACAARNNNYETATASTDSEPLP